LNPFEMPTVEPPSFPDRVFDVRSFGAVDDGLTLNTEAFRRAVDVCHKEGGGVVCIPAGTWLTGPIHLRSGVNLRLDDGALVRFGTCLADYLPVVFTRWEGVECYNYSPLIYARDDSNRQRPSRSTTPSLKGYRSNSASLAPKRRRYAPNSCRRSTVAMCSWKG